MLHDFLSINRATLIARCAQMVASRPGSKPPNEPVLTGIPIFLDQLIKTLQIEQTAERGLSLAVSGHAGIGGSSEIGTAAILHGHELFERGFTLEQAVRDYGDLCQAITGLAEDVDAPIEVDEFRTFNRCLDNAIAGAVTEYANEQRLLSASEGIAALNTRMGSLAHELRNLVQTATLAVRALKSGNVGLSGATGAVLDRCLRALTSLIDRSLAEVRVSAGLPAQQQVISLAEFITDVASAARFDAEVRESTLIVETVDPALYVNIDRDMLTAAVINLLQNAFKFTRRQTEVRLSARASGERVRIDVQDHCGGLPPGANKMFQPFSQNGEDRSGLGLGLDITRRSVEANDGVLSVTDRPGSGCVFTIDLPLQR